MLLMNRAEYARNKRFTLTLVEPSVIVLYNIVNAVKSCMTNLNLDIDDISFIGIGVPGTVDTAGTRVVYAPNLNWRDIELVRILKQDFSCEMRVEQDAKAAAAGELLAGAGSGMRDIVCWDRLRYYYR